ncbi:MAG: hypothetical protein U0V75_08430 [Ferruginibacter sp.]
MKHRYRSGAALPAKSVLIWRVVQTIMWLVGFFIIFSLLFFPDLGILIFWNILIPVAPALLVVFTGLWRNVCPLGITALLPRHAGLSKRKKLSTLQLGKLNLIAVLLLYMIVPLRHAIFNSNGPATGILIISMAAVSMAMGMIYEWKSAWCSGLCPVHPVEKLYGINTVMTIPNAHCAHCMNCVVPCPDSTPNIHPQVSSKTIYHTLSGWLIAGGLPGFIWGWFHVPDEATFTSFAHAVQLYQLPLVGMAVTLVLYTILLQLLPAKYHNTVIRCFAAAAVSCYYWFRLPALFGFGKFNNDGLLISLRNILPAWSVSAICVAAMAFFFYWIVVRKPNKRSWVIRPAFDSSLKQKLFIPFFILLLLINF